MDMRKTRLLIAALAATALCVPASALGAAIVPPGNSAVNQYTQQVPTAGGNVQGGSKAAKPNKVLGKKTTSELAQQGPDGQAAAELAAETAAPSAAPVSEESSAPAKPAGGGKGDQKKKEKKHKKAPKPSGGKEKGAAAGTGGGASGPSSGSGQGAGSTGAASGGSSALGQIAAQATGTSSGQLGLLMPLALVLGLLFCGAYLARNRRLAP